MDHRLGKPADLADYLRKAQYLNYEGIRAMYEAFESNRFRATGVIQWMYNASWPKLWWQLYDYYLMPTAAFYGARKAGEPVHLAYHYGQGTVELINNTLRAYQGLHADIRVLDFNLKEVMHQTPDIPKLAGQQTLSLLQLPANLPLTKTWFLSLRLLDAQNHPLSRNFYVLSTRRDSLDEPASTWYVTPQAQYADLSLLQQLPPVKLKVQNNVDQKGDTTFVHMVISNPTHHLAFMVWLDMKKGRGEQSVTPVFWDDNYFTLLPGEEVKITGYCHRRDLGGNEPHVEVSGWNVRSAR